MSITSGCTMGNCASPILTRPIFEWLGQFDKIIVTGPQRSGTRICARMIAYDTGYSYIDESKLRIDSLYHLWSIVRTERHFVVQCPALCRHIHLFDAEDSAIILMRRAIKDIIASQERIGWRWGKVELARYDRSEGIIAEVKYRFWEDYQRERIRHAFEIDYASLSGHPLWISQNLRGDFAPGQTELQASSR